jgi:quinolinate synthase
MNKKDFNKINLFKKLRDIIVISHNYDDEFVSNAIANEVSCYFSIKLGHCENVDDVVLYNLMCNLFKGFSRE